MKTKGNYGLEINRLPQRGRINVAPAEVVLTIRHILRMFCLRIDNQQYHISALTKLNRSYILVKSHHPRWQQLLLRKLPTDSITSTYAR